MNPTFVDFTAADMAKHARNARSHNVNRAMNDIESEIREAATKGRTQISVMVKWSSVENTDIMNQLLAKGFTVEVQKSSAYSDQGMHIDWEDA